MSSRLLDALNNTCTCIYSFETFKDALENSAQRGLNHSQGELFEFGHCPMFCTAPFIQHTKAAQSTICAHSLGIQHLSPFII